MIRGLKYITFRFSKLLTIFYRPEFEIFLIAHIRPCKKLNAFFVSNGSIKVKILGNDPVKPVTHAVHLKKIFPDIEIDNL